jgi:hypothetical protein
LHCFALLCCALDCFALLCIAWLCNALIRLGLLYMVKCQVGIPRTYIIHARFQVGILDFYPGMDCENVLYTYIYIYVIC